MQPTSGKRPSLAAQALMFVGAALAMLGNYYVYDSIGPIAEQLSRQLHFSDSQIGLLNAIYSVPNIFLVFVGGVLVDRYSARLLTLVTAFFCLAGAVLTAATDNFVVMAAGRLIFGIGAETMIVAVLVALAQWYLGRYYALFLALNLSIARLGSYLADRSPTFASDLYAQGVHPPLWLAVGFAVVAVVGSLLYFEVDRREAPRGTLATPPPRERFDWREILRFGAPYWCIMGLCVTFYSVIFPFRSTFSIKYFQQAHGLSLEAASTINSYVFLAAAFATPAFGLLVDRIGRHATLMVVGSLLLPVSFLLMGATPDIGLANVLMGVAFSLVPAVLWPAVARYVAMGQLGTALGLMTMLQNIGMAAANYSAGLLNDTYGASATNPGGYLPMLWFFGFLGLAGFVSAVLLKLLDRKPVQQIATA